MKNDIYTLTLDYTRPGQESRITRWVRQTHREAMKRVRYAIEHGDGSIDARHEGYPLQSWKLDSGWQDPSLLTRARK